MQAVNSSFYNHQYSGNTQSYPASVPLSVYRELATELQAAQGKIDALTAQNYQLARENQLLRQEIAKTVQSVLQLQNILDSPNHVNYNQVPRSTPHRKHENQPPVTPKHPRQQVPRPQQSFVYTELEIPDSMEEPFFVEEQQVISSYSPHQRNSDRVNNWLFFLAVILIICLGFGAGYLIVRPLFEHHTPNSNSV